MAFLIRLVLRLALGGPLALGSLAAMTPAQAPAATPAPATTPAATPAAAGFVRGADVSWPNCPKGEGIPSRRSKGEPMPEPSARFVVVGVTNGPGFHPNPCLGRELLWVANHHRILGGYALTTYPAARQIRRYGHRGPFPSTSQRGEVRNAGYAEARYNIRTMTRFGMQVPMIWVDVEPYPTSPWSRHRAANRADVTGVIRGYRDAGYRVGIYTYANGWRDVVGRWRLPSVPTWSTAGHGSPRRALAMCTHGPSGGQTWLAQWWRSARRDFDLTCPAATTRGSQMFRNLAAP